MPASSSSPAMDPATRREPTTRRVIRGKLLGGGSHGAVSLGTIIHGDSSTTTIAIKSAIGKSASYLRREKMFLDQLHGCPRVIACYGDIAGAIADANNSNTVKCGGARGIWKSMYSIYIEYVPGGSLHDYLRLHPHDPMDEFAARRYTRSMLQGLVQIHRRGVIHCDIKPENVMLSGPDEVKIIDFGLSLRSCDREEPGRYRGTPHYLAPECISKSEYGAPSDVWALGCTVAEMLLGKPAIAYLYDVVAADTQQLLALVGAGEATPEIPGNMSALGKDFLSKCFEVDSRKRWTPEMLLRHPYVTQDLVDVDVDVQTSSSSTATATATGSTASSSSPMRSPERPHCCVESER